MNVTNLLIAVPAYGEALKVQCVQSLLQLQKMLQARGVKVRFDFTSYAEVAAVRNLFGTLIVEHTNASHLLFVDTDMQFRSETVERLIDAHKQVIGCFYARRTDRGGVVGVVDTPTQVPADGLIEAAAVGMGLCLIESSVFRKLAASGTVTSQTEHPFEHRLRGPLLGFFNPPAGETAYMSEDIAFCRRWRGFGGKVHAFVREQIGHVGEKVYERDTLVGLILPPPISHAQPSLNSEAS